MRQSIEAQTSLRNPSFRSGTRARLRSFVLATFVTITTLAIFVPLNPDMPDKEITPSWIAAITEARRKSDNILPLAKIDQSWRFGVNEAVARHLRFGKEIIFPFGPYASIYTRSFHPATDRLMIFGSLLLALSYVVTLLYLADGRTPYTLMILLLFLVTFPSRDALLFSFPFLPVVCALRFANSDGFKQSQPLNSRQILAIGVTFSALGLLPLVKGGLLFPTALSVAVLCVFLLYHFPYRQAIPLTLIPVLATIIFWTIAGQALSDLPAFVRNILLLTAGYTDAMSSPWMAWPKMIGHLFVIAYVAASALIYVSLIRSFQLKMWMRWLLGFVSAAFLLVAFKHGFVRADHLAIAFNSFAIIILTITFLYADRYLIGSLIVVIVLVGGIYFRYDPVLIGEIREHFGSGTATGEEHRREILSFISRRAIATFPRVTYESTWSTYTDAWRGMRSRLAHSNRLQERFARALANIRSEYNMPALKGTVDIYTYEQSVLLASNNEWNPRPIFQSYSAYTPALEELNEQHLRGANAPGWVLLDLLAIDGRLPSMEDGLSWPALLDNYTFTSFDGQFVLMQRNQAMLTRSNFDVIGKGMHKTGMTVTLPQADGPLFAEIDLKPTVLGRLLMALYKPPQLNLKLKLKNGKVKNYRIVSNMIATGFILSPLVSNTGEFASLAVGNQRFQDEAKVDAMSIEPSYGGSVFWSSTYTLTLKTYRGQPARRS
jgi:hypothetical protein